MLTKVSVYGSTPLWVLALIIGLPFMFLDLLTIRLLSAPFDLLLAPLIAWVRSSSDIWAKSPVVRPLLILPMPFVIVLSMILIYFLPHEPDVRATKNVLVEL